MKRHRGWALVLTVLIALVLLALPAVAFAQTADGEVDAGVALTWEALGTVAGAAAAATIAAQAMKWVHPEAEAALIRIVMMGISIGLVELVALMHELSVQSGVVALFAGLSAAVVAMKGYETWKHGLNAEVVTPVKSGEIGGKYGYLGPQ